MHKILQCVVILATMACVIPAFAESTVLNCECKKLDDAMAGTKYRQCHGTLHLIIDSEKGTVSVNDRPGKQVAIADSNTHLSWKFDSPDLGFWKLYSYSKAEKVLQVTSGSRHFTETHDDWSCTVD